MLATLIPMPRRETLHPDLLLCERCGYRLDGLDSSLPCPECGTPIGESLPSRRVGSAWQRRPGFVAWVATNWTTIRHPWTRWDEVRGETAYGLLLCNTGSVAMVAAYALVKTSGDTTNATEFALWCLLLGVLLWPAVNILSLIEGLGLRMLGARNKWRTTKEVSGAIIAHASIGWLLGVPVLVAEVVYFRTMDPMGALGWAFADWWWQALVWAAAPLAGLLGFEVLAWLGWRRMKFANRTPRIPIEGV